MSPLSALVALHQAEAVVLWPRAELAMIREEWQGRLEFTSGDGQVAHRPGPLQDFRGGPLHEIAPGVLVNPRFVHPDGDGLRVPGGWRLPPASLPEPEPAPEPDPDLVVGATSLDTRIVWLTRGGVRAGPDTLDEAQRERPDLVRVGAHLVAPGAVRRLSRSKGVGKILLDGGFELQVPRAHLPGFHRVLGLPWPDDLAGVPEGHRRVYELGLRDWPEELLHTPDAELRRRYGEDPLRLVDDVIWEAYRRRRGRATEHRGLFYNPLKVLAARAGLLTAAGSAEDRLWLQLQQRLDLFVGEGRLFTYRELGFLDRGAANRRLGEARPHVVLLAEKGSLQRDAFEVAERFGVSVLVLGGVPTWIATEFFCEALRPRLSGPLSLVSYCDFDPYGWSFPRMFARQLERYGVAVEGVVRLVKPSRFTPEELDWLAVDVPIPEPRRRQVEEWLAESGGVNGQAKALYADFLQPVERVLEAFRSETGLEPLS